MPPSIVVSLARARLLSWSHCPPALLTAAYEMYIPAPAIEEVLGGSVDDAVTPTEHAAHTTMSRLTRLLKRPACARERVS